MVTAFGSGEAVSYPLQVAITLDGFMNQRPAMRSELDRLCYEYRRRVMKQAEQWVINNLPQRDAL